MKRFLVAVLAGLVFAAVARAEEVRFELSAVPGVLTVGEAGELQLAFDGTVSVPPLDLPAVDGLQIRYLGPSTSMSVVNGVTSGSITHVYAVVPLRAGEFIVGPLKFEHEGATYVSNQLKLDVGGGSRPAAAPEAADTGAGNDLRDRIALTVEAAKTRVYVNERIPIRLKLLVNGLNVRAVQYPAVKHEGLSLEPWEQHRQYRQAAAGKVSDVIEFPAAFFALRPGALLLGPSSVQCTILARQQRAEGQSTNDFFGADMFAEFFGGYRAMQVQVNAGAIPITVMGLPQEGKPANFSGAVGAFTLDVTAAPRQVRVGDPITLRMAVRGEGNFKTVGAPRLSSSAGFKMYDPQARDEAGARVFEQVIMPLDAGVNSIPAITFSYFDPDAGSYKTLMNDPVPVTVLPAEKEDKQMIVDNGVSRAPEAPEALGSDIVYIKETPGRLFRGEGFIYRSPAYRWAHVIPVILFFVLAGVRGRLRRLETDTRYARKLKAPGKAAAGIRAARALLASGDGGAFFDTVHRTLQEYLGARLHLSSAAITFATVDEALRGRAVDGAVVARLRELFDACDAARYAAGPCETEAMRQALRTLEETIDYFQRRKA